MLDAITLKNFKSFEDATLPLRPLTVLIGANASGKTNAIEGLQLLAWMAEGRRLGSLLSAVRDEELSLRGALPQLCWREDDAHVTLGCRSVSSDAMTDASDGLELSLTLDVGERADGVHDFPAIVGETLTLDDKDTVLYQATMVHDGLQRLEIRYDNDLRGGNLSIPGAHDQPVFHQLQAPGRFSERHTKAQKRIPQACRRVAEDLLRVRILDPSPRAMRGYSHKTDVQLRTDAANLSAVLNRLCSDPAQRAQVLDFVRDVPEQDISDISFLVTERGDVMVALYESLGGRTSRREAALLSDGTLRVLAVAAALLSAEPGATVVIEEIDNGVHPNRVRDLVARVEAISRTRDLRVLVTTHNPALLDALPLHAVPDVVLCYRDRRTGASQLTRLEDLARYPDLVASGALGQAVTRGTLQEILDDDEPEAELRARHAAFFRDLARESA
ncbi:MAG: AAA family ATPase [Acidobacteriota bacterium]